MGQKTLYVKGVFLVIIRGVAVEGMLGEIIFVGQKRADAAKLQDALAAIQHGKLIHAQQLPSPKTGEMYHPDSVVNIHKKILKDAGLEHLRFHDLRHPYVKYTTKIFSLRLMDFQAQAYNSFERLPPPMPISISSIVCSGSFLFLEKSFPGTFTHASKFAAVFFIAWNNADRTRSGYDFLFTWKASLKNVIIFKAKPSIFIDLSNVFSRNIVFICPPALK